MTVLTNAFCPAHDCYVTGKQPVIGISTLSEAAISRTAFAMRLFRCLGMSSYGRPGGRGRKVRRCFSGSANSRSVARPFSTGLAVKEPLLEQTIMANIAVGAPAPISVESLSVITYQQQPVVTTELLANLYGTSTNSIKKNFSVNAGRFTEGKHFFRVEGEQLRSFKHYVTESNLVAIHPRTRHLILWTERGAARHAKMLETDQAWEVFEKLEDCYFNSSSQKKLPSPSPESTYTLTLTEYECYHIYAFFRMVASFNEDLKILEAGLRALRSPIAAHVYSMHSETSMHYKSFFGNHGKKFQPMYEKRFQSYYGRKP